jgi:uncharacterized protein (DUF488 family)
MKVYTIGHGARSIEEFLKIVKSKGINLIVDIREKPVSRYYPHFNRRNLEKVLKENGIEYLYAGDYLGGSAEFHNDLLEYIKGRGDRNRISPENKLLDLIDEETRRWIFESKQEEVSNDNKRKQWITEKYLAKYIDPSKHEKAIHFLRTKILTPENKSKTICFLCAEKDYRFCHRSLLLEKEWLKNFPDVQVEHLVDDPPETEKPSQLGLF